MSSCRKQHNHRVKLTVIYTSMRQTQLKREKLLERESRKESSFSLTTQETSFYLAVAWKLKQQNCLRNKLRLEKNEIVWQSGKGERNRERKKSESNNKVLGRKVQRKGRRTSSCQQQCCDERASSVRSFIHDRISFGARNLCTLSSSPKNEYKLLHQTGKD